MEGSTWRRMLGSLKVKALSQPSIGSLFIWGWTQCPRTLPPCSWNHPVLTRVRMVNGAEIEQQEQNPVQLQAVWALLFVCSHFGIIKAAPESIRVSLVSF